MKVILSWAFLSCGLCALGGATAGERNKDTRTSEDKRIETGKKTLEGFGQKGKWTDEIVEQRKSDAEGFKDLDDKPKQKRKK